MPKLAALKTVHTIHSGGSSPICGSGEHIKIHPFQGKTNTNSYNLPRRTQSAGRLVGGDGDHLVVLKALLTASPPAGTDLEFTPKWSHGRQKAIITLGLG